MRPATENCVESLAAPFPLAFHCSSFSCRIFIRWARDIFVSTSDEDFCRERYERKTERRKIIMSIICCQTLWHKTVSNIAVHLYLKNIKYSPPKTITTPLRIKLPDSHAQVSAVRHKFLSITAVISAHKNDLYITRALVLKLNSTIKSNYHGWMYSIMNSTLRITRYAEVIMNANSQFELLCYLLLATQSH